MNGLEACAETDKDWPWVLAKPHQTRNLFREAWWRQIAGKEHRWVRALNSSQCFAVNLFSPLLDDAAAAAQFVARMAPIQRITEADRALVRFEHTLEGIAAQLGERGQPTQVDVFFEFRRGEHAWEAVKAQAREKKPLQQGQASSK